MLRFVVSAVCVVSFSLAFAHQGGRDSMGGHFDRKSGQYHCHTKKCFDTRGQGEEALNQAKREKRKFTEMYDRQSWPHWVDSDRDCQDSRAEALIRESRVEVKFKRNKGCVVSHGEWLDPYSGKLFTKASKLDIDHIVPLKEAHISGAASWSRKQKRAFANDPQNLIVVNAKANRSKGARDPSEWLPQNSYRCKYIEAWIAIKQKYELSSDKKEKKAISKILKQCN